MSLSRVLWRLGAVAALSLLACSGGYSTAEHVNHGADTREDDSITAIAVAPRNALPMVRGRRVSVDTNPLAELAAQCTRPEGHDVGIDGAARVTAKWDGVECHCPAGYGPFAMVRDEDYESGTCLRVVTEESRRGVNDHHAEALKLRIGAAVVVEEAARLVERMNASIVEFARRADWVESGAPVVPGGFRYKPSSQLGIGVVHTEKNDSRGIGTVVGAPSNSEVREAVLGLFNGPRKAQWHPQRPMRLTFGQTTFEPDPTAVVAAEGVYGTSGLPPELAPVPAVYLEELQEDRRDRVALAEAYRHFVQTPSADEFLPDVAHVEWGSSCLDACRTFSKRLALAVEGVSYTVLLERLYSAGAIAREVLWVESSERFAGAVQMSKNRGAGMLLQATTTVAPSEAAFAVRVYNRRWDLLGTTSFHAEVNAAQARAVGSTYDERATPKGSLLVECEGDGGFPTPFSPDGTPHTFARSVLYGPHVATFERNLLRHGSLYGWNPNLGANYHDYVSGLWDGDWSLNDRGLAALAHGEAVVRAAQSQMDLVASQAGGATHKLFILPMDDRQCFQTSQWKTAIDLGLARVVNMSWAVPYEDATSCEVEGQAAEIAAHPNILWVAAAGNQMSGSAEVDARYFKPVQCPQSVLRAKRNGLVVAAVAGEGGPLQHEAFTGHDYADIAADGKEPGSLYPYAATSYAAPRVSATAVALVQAYPSLSAGAVRAAILLGSSPREELSTHVRSGGELDVKGAFRWAACFEKKKVNEVSAEVARSCATEASDGAPARIEFLLRERNILGD